MLDTTASSVAAIYRQTRSLKQTALKFNKSSYWIRMKLLEAQEPINPPTPSKFDASSAQQLREAGYSA